jgi:hypothetical protein
MRIKAGDRISHDTVVYLDGERLDKCVEADDSEGWADVATDNGKFLLFQHSGETPPVKRRFGKVEFRSWEVDKK